MNFVNLFNIKLFFTALMVFFVTDMLWLGVIAKGMYFESYGAWLRLANGRLDALWWAAILVYVLFALSMIVIIEPLSGGQLMSAALYGGFLGLVVYGVYDFTCLAIFKDFPVGMAFVDVAWGTFLYGWSAFASLWLLSLFK